MSTKMGPTYQQVKDILNTVRGFYKQLTEFYAGLSETSDKEKVQILLKYMSHHERKFEHAFAQYSDETGRKLLETWIQYPPDPNVLYVPKAKELDRSMTVDDVADIAKELDDRLERFYSEAARLVESVELKDFFETLKEFEEAEKANVAENAVYIKKDM
jgi:rubrerythrin